MNSTATFCGRASVESPVASVKTLFDVVLVHPVPLVAPEVDAPVPVTPTHLRKEPLATPTFSA